MKRIKSVLGFLAACVLAEFSLTAVPIDALTFPDGGNGASGTAFGGVGWSFVPITNITVTSVGYLDLAEAGGNPNVVVTIWSGTTNVLASYTGITNPGAPQSSLITNAVSPLTLTAGKTYSITANLAPLATSQMAVELYDNTGAIWYNPFNLTPELSQFHGLVVSQAGVFAPAFPPPDDSSIFYLGPTFSFVTGIPAPSLQIYSFPNHNVQLAWPTNAAGFALQRAAAVTGAYTTVTNIPSISGASYIVTLPATNSGYFRLSKPNP